MSNEIVRIEGWDLVNHEDGEPRIQDLELARRLEYTELRDIRELIQRMISDGSFRHLKNPVIQTRRTTRRVAREGRGEVDMQVTEALLTEQQALMVVRHSKTNKADEVMAGVIEVFVTYRRSRPPVLTNIQILLGAVTQLAQQEQELIRHQEELTRQGLELEATKGRIAELEAHVDNPSDFYTILGWAHIIHLKIARPRAAILGKRCSSLSKARGIQVFKVKDERYGEVNTYHKSVLIEVVGPEQ